MKITLLHRIYLAGYSGWVMPRWLRAVRAGSEVHRAWLLGSKGIFVEQRVRHGPANPYPAAVFFEDAD